MPGIIDNREYIDAEIAAALVTAENGNEALRNLYRILKKSRPHFSLGFLCKKASIPSTGYLSDVMSRRRRLHPKYREGIIKALSLQGSASEYLELMLLSDHDDGRENMENTVLKKRLEVARKNLLVRLQPLPKMQTTFLFAFEIFCSFGLFKNKPTIDDLCRYFGEERRQDINDALASLIEMHLIAASEEYIGQFRLTADQVIFSEEEGGLSHIEFLKTTLTQSSQDVEHWFSQREQSFFSSSVISVKKADFERLLPQIKSEINSVQSQLESGDADSLIHFNVQIYPLKQNRKAV